MGIFSRKFWINQREAIANFFKNDRREWERLETRLEPSSPFSERRAKINCFSSTRKCPLRRASFLNKKSNENELPRSSVRAKNKFWRSMRIKNIRETPSEAKHDDIPVHRISSLPEEIPADACTARDAKDHALPSPAEECTANDAKDPALPSPAEECTGDDAEDYAFPSLPPKPIDDDVKFAIQWNFRVEIPLSARELQVLRGNGTIDGSSISLDESKLQDFIPPPKPPRVTRSYAPDETSVGVSTPPPKPPRTRNFHSPEEKNSPPPPLPPKRRRPGQRKNLSQSFVTRSSPQLSSIANDLPLTVPEKIKK